MTDGGGTTETAVARTHAAVAPVLTVRALGTEERTGR